MKEQAKREQNRLQREKIRAFDKNEIDSYTTLMNHILCGMFTVFAVMLLMFPVQEDEYVTLYGGLFALWAAFYRINQYTKVKEGENKIVSLYDKLKYLAIDRKQIILVRIEYLFRFQSKVLLAALVAQIVGAYLASGKVTWENILWVLMASWGIPILVVSIDIIFSTRDH